MNANKHTYSLLILFSLLANVAFSQPSGERAAGGPPVGFGPPPYRWSAGVGLIYSSSPYVGNSPIVIPIPLITYRGERLSILGPFATYTMWESGPFRFSAKVGVEFEGYEEDDDELLRGLGDRGITLEAGGELKIELVPDVDLKIQLVREVTGEHDGWTADASLSRTWRNRGTFIIPALYFKAHDENYTQYYFGIPAASERPDRPRYEPTESFRYGAGLTVRRPIHDRWMWMARGDVMLLSDEITDSPLVEDELEFGLMAGVSWQF